ncbi:hypothetical protein [Desulfovibrio sp. JC022]|uniref:hypothetical protein n=1 Tax=Desulfovibrio sp. JC022 TaxID=2593642 RepID=UPI0013D57CA8|nr:hypothetical protein [Desulfovibrio sp. JC022]NDV21899.1 hypothetical protein [Desulfovibrio sp. JC022]
MTDLNKTGAQAGWEVAKTAKDLAEKEAKYDVSLQAKQDRKASAAADKRNDQRRAAIEATSGWSSPLADTVDPNQQAKPKADVPALDTKQAKKNKNGLSIMELGTSGLKGAAKGAPIGATWGSTLGPAGTLAGFLTGAFVGAPVQMLYDVGAIAISDIFGADKDSQGRLRDAMEKSNTKSKRR